MKIDELEKRLGQEPDNLGLRVTVAGMLHEAGRTREAIALYRSVAVAYRDAGRRQQALAVCKSILELAPDDAACAQLVASLSRPASRADDTPLPRPVPHHVADPTSAATRISPSELEEDTHPEGTDLAAELDTRKRRRLDSSQLRKVLAVAEPPAVEDEVRDSAEITRPLDKQS